MPRLALLRLRRSHFDRFLADQSGATAIEYALIAAGVAVTVASSVYSLGSEVKTNLFGKLSDLMGTF